ncbi:MerR family transcriptional regulator [Streptomyces sp. NPDC005438]|uniref:MerR family transcriptional regulator n=1 Tax=Streptomyces sp. NPDC005438 TaxID=3156880 RepID=UPI0033A6472A
MRIKELASMVGVTPRAVRHYHHQGLLPEPERLPNGYRDYGIQHAVVLARIRRLTDLGLGLAEVRDVLADDAHRQLGEVLAELDEDLARQQEVIAERRRHLAVLIERAERGELPPEGPVSDQLAELFGALSPTDSPSAAKDRSHLALLDSLVTEDQREDLLGALRSLTDTAEGQARVGELYRRLDELAEAPTDDPAVERLARDLVEAVPERLLRLMRDGDQDPSFEAALLADFTPAQAAVIRRMLALASAPPRRERP